MNDAALVRAQEKTRAKGLHLIRDGSTRWNSTQSPPPPLFFDPVLLLAFSIRSHTQAQ